MISWQTKIRIIAMAILLSILTLFIVIECGINSLQNDLTPVDKTFDEYEREIEWWQL